MNPAASPSWTTDTTEKKHAFSGGARAAQAPCGAVGSRRQLTTQGLTPWLCSEAVPVQVSQGGQGAGSSCSGC